MHAPHLPRRRFLTASLAPAAAFCTLTTGCQSQARLRDLRFTTLSEAQHELDRLAALIDRPQTADWTWGATLTHCAQSIHFALTGFPQAKSPLFQRTVGAAAFQIFAWQGRMQHDLSEPIPGAPALNPAVDAQTALTHLHDVITAFHRHTGALHPHFAYGALSKAQYELANAMHLANHLSAFDVSPVV
ncbi:DUF1569 domain-containing protein [Aquabacterium sp.]|uniref:DUF1569 domain-containing protein n=1 Tax=Aquabacterium sp. TaxID=1872578 RepID=UPI0027BA3A26|nr:DUF1569 domain-containing protein [Aquabacterium sp.]